MKSEKAEPIIARVADNLYVGNLASAESAQILQKYNIHTVINISGEDVPPHVHTINFMLPSQELMPTEQQKTVTKLEAIAKEIRAVVANKQCVLVNCFDGKNKCTLAAGYFLIMEGRQHTEVIPFLETLYFSDKQKLQEKEDKILLAVRNPSLGAIEMTTEKCKLLDIQRTERRKLRCLNMISFVKLLQAVGNSKK